MSTASRVSHVLRGFDQLGLPRPLTVSAGIVDAMADGAVASSTSRTASPEEAAGTVERQLAVPDLSIALLGLTTTIVSVSVGALVKYAIKVQIGLPM